MLYFVKCFAEKAAGNFKKIVKKLTAAFHEHKAYNRGEQKYRGKINCEADIERKALD
jgi:hypothetical protein